MSEESSINSATNEINQSQLRINPPLFKLKILDGLKNINIDQLKSLVQSIENTVNAYELEQVKGLILNLAVQVASVKLISKLLSEECSKDFGIDINKQDSEGNTPLHLVALNNRLDVAQLLLRDSRINDTILNNNLKQPIDLTKDLNMISLMQYERGCYIEKIAIEFKQAFINHDMAMLDEILAVPRNYELLDINGYDPETGETVLHEFIKKNDIGMVKWILGHGGDPFKRDKKGKLPLELVGKSNETMRQILKEASQKQSVIDSSTGRIGGITAPTYKGYLRKWTNFASGYKLRWFVLDPDGILSYYKSQEDTNNACRGSLNMKSALLHLDSSEKLKFEIIGSSGSRWHLKGNHPIETNRWVWSLQGAIRYSKDKAKATKIALEQASNGRVSLDQRNLLLGVKYNAPSRRNSSSSIHTTYSNLSNHNTYYSTIEKTKNSKSLVHAPIMQDSEAEDDEDEDDEYNGLRELEDINGTSDPFFQEISVLKSRFSIELSSLKDLLELLQKSNMNDETLDISLKSVDSLIVGLTNYNDLIAKRDEKLIKSLNKQRDINELWINSIRDLENELLAKNEELETFKRERKKIKKALNRKQSYSAPMVTSFNEELSESTVPSSSVVIIKNEVIEKNDIIESISPKKAPLSSRFEDSEYEISRILQDDDDSDDEFFDADEFSDTEEEIQGLVVDNLEVTSKVSESQKEKEEEEEKEEINDETTLISTIKEKTLEPISKELHKFNNELQRKKYELLISEGSFLGYEDPIRTDLPLKVDDRPKISLWGILKSMIGKDVTKISLPVTFNEPTSMLQRIAEGLEYSSLLDEAATFDDSTKRLLYVAAFAASEYSSTIGRIAKPFNPLLGETFEYSRPDLGFRYFTEQVSHHPPVNATHTESAKWDFYGETSVKAGFNGRSFDARPLGDWFLHLRPDSENQEEIYTWKKITSSVGGIMLGNPQIDNYGEMEIINNKTSDKCIVNFKQKGWRGTSAYELGGVVVDVHGKKHWAIAGHWNSKIYGKKVTGKETDNIKDDTSGNKFVIWQPAPRPEVPFNLTKYAISLNALQPKLLPWLSKSDTRLRPDQRAMEDGRYDDASRLKNEVEEKQRTTRKARAKDNIQHKPNFFIRSIHPLTGKEYWKFLGDYWSLRKDHKLPSIDIFV